MYIFIWFIYILKTFTKATIGTKHTLKKSSESGSGEVARWLRALAALPEVLRLVPSAVPVSSQLSTTPVPGDLRPSSSLHRYPHTYGTHMQRCVSSYMTKTFPVALDRKDSKGNNCSLGKWSFVANGRKQQQGISIAQDMSVPRSSAGGGLVHTEPRKRWGQRNSTTCGFIANKQDSGLEKERSCLAPWLFHCCRIALQAVCWDMNSECGIDCHNSSTQIRACIGSVWTWAISLILLSCLFSSSFFF